MSILGHPLHSLISWQGVGGSLCLFSCSPLGSQEACVPLVGWTSLPLSLPSPVAGWDGRTTPCSAWTKPVKSGCPRQNFGLGRPLLFPTSGSAAAHCTSRQSLSRPCAPSQGVLPLPHMTSPHCILLSFRSHGDPGSRQQEEGLCAPSLAISSPVFGKTNAMLGPRATSSCSFLKAQGGPGVLLSSPLSLAQAQSIGPAQARWQEPASNWGAMLPTGASLAQREGRRSAQRLE